MMALYRPLFPFPLCLPVHFTPYLLFVLSPMGPDLALPPVRLRIEPPKSPITRPNLMRNWQRQFVASRNRERKQTKCTKKVLG
ncbi:hypothetical protein Ancab_018958 [Ancistrocladus abbreviatus]